LTSSLDLTVARQLPENADIAYMGDTKGGAFDIPADVAMEMINAPINPNGRPNSDVVHPWINGWDITRRPREMWIIDFGVDMPEEEAALYEIPFEYVKKHVKPARLKNKRASYRNKWWIHVEPRPALRAALHPLLRYIGTPILAKHRLFVWLDNAVISDHQLIVFALEDDYSFGVLHSKPHELWSLRQGTSLEDRPRYTSTTTFGTFPFPWPPGREPDGDPHVEAIAEAARELVAKRDNWLNPAGASEQELKKRTLTNLYNQRPTWLDLAHQTLDRAVLAAYGWPEDVGEEGILEGLLGLNLERGC
jgi:type II restriction/modification system DNA methylase subunit YeeA